MRQNAARPFHPLVAATLLALLVLGAGGCAAPATEDRLVVSPARYGDAFEIATDVVRDLGLPAELQSQRLGVIETESITAPSIFELWAVDGSSLSRRWQATLSHERRRARIEFAPDGQPPPAPADRLTGPDVLGLHEDRTSLLQTTGDIRVEVWVFVERAHQPGIRRSTWSRRLTTRSIVIPPGAEEPLPATFWTPVARDREMEQRIMAEIGRRLQGEPSA